MNTATTLEEFLSEFTGSENDDRRKLVELAYISQGQTVYRKALQATFYETADAQDLSHDIWLHLYNVIDKFDPTKGDFLPWMSRVISNFIASYIRRRQAVSHIHFQSIDGGGDGDDTDPIDVPDYSTPDPAISVENRELREQMQRAVAQLTKRQKLVIKLFHEDELSIRDIAEYLDRDVATVKTHLYLGRQTLRKILGKYYSKYYR